MNAFAKLPPMATHPNRSKLNPSPAANPKPAEIRRVREEAGLTQAQAGELVHTSWRTWQNWEIEEGGEARRMHPATWELFNVKIKVMAMLEAGKLTPAEVRKLGVTLPG